MRFVRRPPPSAVLLAALALAAATLGASGAGPAADPVPGADPADPMARFFRGAPGEPVYPNPTDLAVTPDGGALVVACSGTDTLRVLDLPDGSVRSEIPVGRHPSAVALGPDGRTAYVAGRDDDTVTVADLDTGEVLARFVTGRSPQDLLVLPDARTLVTANAVSGDVAFLDLETGRQVKRMRAGERPRALALSPDGGTLAVANLLADPHRPEESPVGQVTLVDLERSRIAARVALPGTNLLRSVAALPDGSFLVPLVRPKNLIPLIQVDGGWQMTNGVALVPPLASEPVPGHERTAGDPLQFLVDTRGHHWADLTSAAVSADGRTAYVPSGGGNHLLVLDLDALRSVSDGVSPEERRRLGDRLDLAPRYVEAAIPTGANPRAVALSPDGARAYVADKLGGTVTVVDTAGRRVERRIELDGPDETTRVRRGELLFHDSEATFHGQFTCVTCHPDSAHDGLVYDISPDGLGRNLVDSKTLHGVAGTAPFKWSGHNPDLRTQCGPRAALFINRSLGFGAEGTDDVVAYMAQIPLEPNRDRPEVGWPNRGLTPLQAQGKRIFERTVDNTGRTIPESNRCGFCHSGPRGTNNRSFDVGTRSEHDDKGLFDTPGLNNLAETGPYLHDGKALSLEEIWTVYNPDDRHGRANDMAKEELNALIEYLKTF